MKKKSVISFVASVCTIISATSSCNLYEMDPEPQTGQVTFQLETFCQSQAAMAPTRADAKDISTKPSRLLVIDVGGGEVLQEIERTENVLEDLTLQLTYGQHDIYIVAASAVYDSYSAEELTVSWSDQKRPSYTWATKVSVTVDQTQADAQPVELPLVIGRVGLVCTDAQPNQVTGMQIKGKICWTLDLTTMKGKAPSTDWNYTIPISNKAEGLSLAVYCFEPTDGTLGNLTFTAIETVEGVETEVTHHTLSAVPVTAGYITNYTGLFYSSHQAFTLATTNKWTNIVEKTY